MKTKEPKYLFGIPSWGLSLLTALLSVVILFILAALLGSISKIDDNISEGIAYIIYDIIIAIACFFAEMCSFLKIKHNQIALSRKLSTWSPLPKRAAGPSPFPASPSLCYYCCHEKARTSGPCGEYGKAQNGDTLWR